MENANGEIAPKKNHSCLVEGVNKEELVKENSREGPIHVASFSVENKGEFNNSRAHADDKMDEPHMFNLDHSLFRASEDVRNIGLNPFQTSIDTNLDVSPTKVVTGEKVKINNEVGLSGDQPNEVFSKLSSELSGRALSDLDLAAKRIEVAKEARM
ncbi:hypothetical protein V6N12_062630 [Hibiscus sabdariffa]|uniref:Uncharacterized protein n=1 Tax=Hibiscus sabdariffa TaxID=183260 RepID=A0ABR2F9G2_9ROSI